jgi:pentatricopeptide repeat protein
VQAETAYRTALTLDANNAEAHAGLADAAYRQCSINTAVQSMATAAGLSPAYRARLAGLYEAQDRASDAAAIYEELAQAPLTDWFAYVTVAEHYNRRGDWDEALRTYQKILEAGTAPAGYVTSLIHSAAGQLEYLQERRFAAGGEFDQALAAFEANVDALAGLGDLAMEEGQADEALARYEEALPYIPRYLAGLPAENQALATVSLHVRRSLALGRLGETQPAAEALERAMTAAEGAVDLSPRSPLAQFALGLAYLAAGETELSEAAFERAGECDRTLIAARERLEAGLARLESTE